nr:uncharacterized protein LOC125994133 [Syngnathus scovelli]
MHFDIVRTLPKNSYRVVVAEWLRRWTRNPLGSPRAGSNPADNETVLESCCQPCHMHFDNMRTLPRLSCRVVVAEWLRRWTRNPLGSPRTGSNPADNETVLESCCQPCHMHFDNVRTLPRPSCRVVVAEWLRRWTRNPLGSPRAGSNPADNEAHFVLESCQPRQMHFDHVRTLSELSSTVVVAEWLRRWTRNPLGSPRAGSNPAGKETDFVLESCCQPRHMHFDNVRTLPENSDRVVVAEWLRRWTRNPLGSPRAGSNPADNETDFVLESCCQPHHMHFDNVRTLPKNSYRVVVAEWLRRWTRNPLGSSRAGSNPADNGADFVLGSRCQPLQMHFDNVRILPNHSYRVVVAEWLRRWT